jgi:hypothetical protein
MKPARLLVAVVMIGVGCTGGSPEAAGQKTPPSAQTDEPSPHAENAQDPPPRDARIYSAVIRQLLVDRSQTRSDVVYVVNGAIAGAGKPRGDPFSPSTQRFGRNVVDGIRHQLNGDLPPFQLIIDGNNVLRKNGVVKNGGVLISLGPIERRSKRRVLVANTFWCGGKCSQWQTYVVSNKNGRWRITGVSGPVVGS